MKAPKPGQGSLRRVRKAVMEQGCSQGIPLFNAPLVLVITNTETCQHFFPPSPKTKLMFTYCDELLLTNCYDPIVCLHLQDEVDVYLL